MRGTPRQPSKTFLRPAGFTPFSGGAYSYPRVLRSPPSLRHNQRFRWRNRHHGTRHTHRQTSMPHGRNYRDPWRINRRARNLARQRVLAQQVPCAICDRPIDDAIAWSDPMSAEVDEIIPVSRGGSATDLRNLEKVHRCCNQLKSDKSLAWARQKSQRRSGSQAHRRVVQHFGLVTGLGTVSSRPGVRLPRSIVQIPPHDFPNA